MGYIILILIAIPIILCFINIFKCINDDKHQKQNDKQNYEEFIKGDFERNLENKVLEFHDFKFKNNLSGQTLIGVSSINDIRIISESFVILVDFYGNTMVYEYSNIKDCESDYNKLKVQVNLYNKHEKNYNDLIRNNKNTDDYDDSDVDDGGFS